MANTIKTVGDFLMKLRDNGVKEIEPYLNIGHNPTIGDMFEGLTKRLLERVVFQEMDLRVTSGKIVNTDGNYSKQIDCMVVVGEGQTIPFTNDTVYLINQVIMVIEVKKNLFMSDLTSGYDNLRSVVETQKNDYRDLNSEAITDAFSAISKKPFTGLASLDVDEQMLFHSLVVEELLPIRVIFGYDGFKDELSLRSKMIEFLQKNVKYDSVEQINNADLTQVDSKRGQGFGITSLPNLIICGNNSIIKTNGMPYALSVEAPTDGFIWLASYRRNPIVLLLELLWTRLTYSYHLSSSIFGDELYDEALAPLLAAKLMKDTGWAYSFFNYSKGDLKKIDSMYDNEWQPETLSQNEFIVMSLLCEKGELEIDELKKMVSSESVDGIDKMIENLTSYRLVYVTDRKVRLLTKQCKCVIDPELGFIAADDYDGRLTNWIMKRTSVNI